MLDFLSSWTGILLGGGFAASIVLLICIYLVGGQKVVDLATDFLRPPLMAIANMAGDVLRLSWENFRDGVVIFCKSKKAIFAVGVLICAFSVGVHYSTKHVTEKRTEAKVWKHVRATYRLSVRPKPKTVVQTSLDTLRKSLGGITP